MTYLSHMKISVLWLELTHIFTLITPALNLGRKIHFYKIMHVTVIESSIGNGEVSRKINIQCFKILINEIIQF